MICPGHGFHANGSESWGDETSSPTIHGQVIFPVNSGQRFIYVDTVEIRKEKQKGS